MKIKNIKSWKFKSKSLVVFLVISSLTFMFLDKISSELIFFGKNIDYHSTSFNIGYGIICGLLILYSIILVIRRYIFSDIMIYSSLYVLIFYIILRQYYTQSIYLIPIYNNIKYSDIIFLLFLIILISTIRFIKYNLLSGDKASQSFFLGDEIYDKGKIDNEAILQKLIEVLSNYKPKNAFSIGVNAVWGYGKSSFLKRFETVYKKSNPDAIVFWYHIWKNKGSTAIIENFFDELKNSLKNDSGEISATIDKYVDSIISIADNNFGKLISQGKQMFSENNTLENYRNKINNSIKAIDKQVIILLDDLDRLEKEEILNSLKLIRTLSDFNNIIFIAGYDREYVVKTINKPKDNYLDKIFNVEINLLPFDAKLIENELLNQVSNVFSQKSNKNNDIEKNSFHAGFRRIFTEKSTRFSDYEPSLLSTDSFDCSKKYTLGYKDFINTYRDVKRFVNEFKFITTISDIENNVIVEEYILLKLLTYKFRITQNLIFNNIDNILKRKQIDYINGKIGDFNNPTLNDIYIYNEESKKVVFSILRKNDVEENDILIINAVLCSLFRKKQVVFYKKNQNTISKLYFTNIYLRNNILGAEVTISRLQKEFDNNNILSIVNEISKSNAPSNNLLQNEIKQFIFNNQPKSKEQFIDLISSLNKLLESFSVLDIENTVTMFEFAYKTIYTDDDEFINDLQIIISTGSIDFLEHLFSNLIYSIEKKRSEKKNVFDNVFKEKESTINDNIYKKVLFFKLEYLLNSDNISLIIELYDLLVEKVILNGKTVLKPIEANKLIKADIENRFNMYFNKGLFDNISSTINRFLIDSNGNSPEYYLCQIFSSNDKLFNLLVLDINDEELYNKYCKEGWDEYYSFIEKKALDKDEVLSKSNRAKLIKIKKFIKKFIDNDYKAISQKEVNEIWNKKE